MLLEGATYPVINGAASAITFFWRHTREHIWHNYGRRSAYKSEPSFRDRVIPRWANSPRRDSRDGLGDSVEEAHSNYKSYH